MKFKKNGSSKILKSDKSKNDKQDIDYIRSVNINSDNDIDNFADDAEDSKKKSNKIDVNILLPKKKKIINNDNTNSDEEDFNRVDFKRLADTIADEKFEKRNKINPNTLRLSAKQRTELTKTESEYASSATAASLGNSSSVPQQRLVVSLDKLSKPLENAAGLKETKKQLSKIKKAEAIQALPSKFIQERATRSIAYEEASKSIAKWIPDVKKNREAKTLDFRTPELGGVVEQPITVRSIAETTVPSNDMEKEIEALLTQSGLNSELEVAKKENEHLLSRKISEEEIKKRHGELLKLRSLMFYEEQKAKRAKKIKSKLYRKIKKRQKHRDEERARELLREIDPKAAKILDMEDATKRAQERMSLRHRNTSRYMRDLIKNRGSQHDAIDAANALNSNLFEKMQSMPKGRGLSRYNNNDSEEEEEEDVMDDIDGLNSEESKKKKISLIKQKAFDEGQELLNEIEDDKFGSELEMKGIMGLKFMQRALDAEKKRSSDSAKELLKDLAKDINQRIHDDENDEEEDNINIVGKRSFQPIETNSSKKRKIENKKSEESKVDTDYGIGEEEPDENIEPNKKRRQFEKDNNSNNNNNKPKKRKIVVSAFKSDNSLFKVPDFGENEENNDNNDLKESKEKNQLLSNESKKQASSSLSSSSSNMANENVELGTDSNPWLSQSTSNRNENNNRNSTLNKLKDVFVDVSGAIKESDSLYEIKNDDNDKNLITDDVLINQQNKKIEKKLEQAELIKRAFADAGVVEQEFEKEKDNALGIDPNDKDINGKIPGWGDWTGIGVTKSRAALKKEQMEEERKKKLKEKEIKEKREKAYPEGLKHVISISSRESKLAEKYKTEKIPYPFQTWEQYEKSLQNPLGSEWKTMQAFNNSIQPEIITKPGVVIPPIKESKEAKNMVKTLIKETRKDMNKKRTQSRKL